MSICDLIDTIKILYYNVCEINQLSSIIENRKYKIKNEMPLIVSAEKTREVHYEKIIQFITVYSFHIIYNVIFFLRNRFGSCRRYRTATPGNFHT